ncbi:PH domain-containing protein [Pseudonocardia sp. ICBG1293]|uniref:PH domain-containing protein n=1 Tax=Pseudonocardia sp. ICBG1293 TaxID=2844382 RepID=UPI001CCFEADC|nr:PH domain-containing protein [Pseudonocardia sp. ICBG1293]
MAFPDSAPDRALDRVLDEGEHVVLLGHPHWRLCLRPAAVLVGVSAVAGFGAAVVRLQPWAPWAWLALGGLAAVLAVRFTLLPIARWRATRFVVTDRRFLIREGLLVRDGLDVPIDRIDSVRVRAGAGDRLFGCGTLLLDVAGERLRFTDVPAVEQVQARLHREIGLLAERRRSHEKESEHTARRGHADAAVRGRMGASAPQRERAPL